MSTAEKLLQAELPPRPAVLASLSAQMDSEEPDISRVSALVSADVGLAAAVIKTVNSSYFGLARQVASVQQGVTYLGLASVFSIVTGALLRRSFPSSDPLMEHLWEDSAQRGALMSRSARELRVLPPDRAYTGGLFEHCGMALLLLHAPGYAEMLKQDAANLPELERARYGSDHAALGQALVRTWGLPEEIALGVRYHHDMARLDGFDIPWPARQLVALSVLVNQALALRLGRSSPSWVEDMPLTARVLNLSSPELEARALALATTVSGTPQ
jgi:HD-like signal output (HDOD) protein